MNSVNIRTAQPNSALQTINHSQSPKSKLNQMLNIGVIVSADVYEQFND